MTNKFGKQNFIEALSEKTLTIRGEEKKLTKQQATEIYNMVFGDDGVMVKALVNDEVISLNGFGTFDVTIRSERNGVNPQNGEPVTYPAAKRVRFKASKVLKERVQ